MKLEKKNYFKYRNTYSISPMFLESAVIDQSRYLEKLQAITKIKPSIDTIGICERERVPRKLNKNDYNDKLENLRSKISDMYITLLDDLIEEYEKDFFENEGFKFLEVYK